MERETACARAEQFLLGAKHLYHEGLLDVAFADARTSCELAAKVLLKDATGHWYRTHDVGGPLGQHHAIPDGIDPRRLTLILRQARRGEYETDLPMTEELVEETIDLAEWLLQTIRKR